jgi:hypothetical protein
MDSWIIRVIPFPVAPESAVAASAVQAKFSWRRMSRIVQEFVTRRNEPKVAS